MAKIHITDINSQAAISFIDELTYTEKINTLGGRLTWEQMYAMDEKFYNLRVQQHRLMDNLSDRLDQQMYNEVMSWELPNNLNI